MLGDKRKHTRKPIRYTAWVVLEDSQRHGCVISDISETGARLELENSDQLPENFLLLLSGRANNAPHRNCRVIWRAPHLIGVHFEKRAAAPVQATPVVKPDGEAAVAAAPAEKA